MEYMMKYILVGCAAFLLFILYDINNVTKKNKLMKAFFALGSFLLIYATYALAFRGARLFILPDFLNWILNVFIAGFALLLFYTLFLALPFRQTYIAVEGLKEVYDQGVYALCRHPGFLWFTGFYFSLWLRTGRSLLLTGGIVFCLLNYLYILLQDIYIFPEQFADYNNYKISTPFLIPNRQSLKRCLDSLPTPGV